MPRHDHGRSHVVGSWRHLPRRELGPLAGVQNPTRLSLRELMVAECVGELQIDLDEGCLCVGEPEELLRVAHLPPCGLQALPLGVLHRRVLPRTTTS